MLCLLMRLAAVVRRTRTPYHGGCEEDHLVKSNISGWPCSKQRSGARVGSSILGGMSLGSRQQSSQHLSLPSSCLRRSYLELMLRDWLVARTLKIRGAVRGPRAEGHVR